LCCCCDRQAPYDHHCNRVMWVGSKSSSVCSAFDSVPKRDSQRCLLTSPVGVDVRLLVYGSRRMGSGIRDIRESSG
ncbi:hypothetical protein PENTCL1PPCAC_13254, partial [Pristionchus entomophagus]